MIDALIKRVSATYKWYETYAHRGKKGATARVFEIDQEIDAILLIIGIVYGVCRIVIKSVQLVNILDLKTQIYYFGDISN
jgi:hypothetical protein